MPGCSWSGATSLPFWLLVIRIRPADVYLRCQENGRFTSIPAHITVVGRCSPHVQGRYDRHQELIFRLYPSGYYPSGLGVSRVSFVNLDHWTADIIRKCLSIFDMGNYTDGAYRRICPSFMIIFVLFLFDLRRVNLRARLCHPATTTTTSPFPCCSVASRAMTTATIPTTSLYLVLQSPSPQDVDSVVSNTA